MKISADEKKSLKGRGIILNRDGETFSVRTVLEDGTATSQQLDAVAKAAERFGNGRAALTMRMSFEIQGVSYENIEPMCAFLAENGLYTGGTGAKIRPVVACKGTVCSHGLIDTQAYARELYERFYLGWRDVALPYKFKISVGGCPNNCIKPSINDFGIMGQRVPDYDSAKCRACSRCNVIVSCPMKICYSGLDQKTAVDREYCTNCGTCISACPFGAVTEKKAGCKLMVGGLWGKRQRIADELPGVYSHDEVFDILERTLNIWRENGKTGERFGLYLERTGFENFLKMLGI